MKIGSGKKAALHQFLLTTNVLSYEMRVRFVINSIFSALVTDSPLQAPDETIMNDWIDVIEGAILLSLSHMQSDRPSISDSDGSMLTATEVVI